MRREFCAAGANWGAFRPCRCRQSREIRIGYLQISVFGSHVGGSLMSPQLKSDSTNLPGKFVEAPSSVPAPVQ
jgi:hypothetical protein